MINNLTSYKKPIIHHLFTVYIWTYKKKNILLYLYIKLWNLNVYQLFICRRWLVQKKDWTQKTKPINAGQSITRTVEAKVTYCNLLHYKIFTTLLCKQFNVTARVKLTTDVQSFACIPLKISIYIFYLHGEEIATFLFRSIYCYSLLQSLHWEFVCSNRSM